MLEALQSVIKKMVNSIFEPVFLLALWDRCKMKAIFVTVSEELYSEVANKTTLH